MNEVNPIKDKRDIEKMKAALHGRDRLMFVIGVSLGLRITDLLSLKIGDIRGKEELYINEQKTGKRRRIKISSTVKAEVSQLTGKDSDYLFPSRKGAAIGRIQAYRILNDAAERAGIAAKVGAIGTHTLRKTFGYQLYKQGLDVTRIMAILNHSTPAMTLKYIGITRDEIDEAYESIEI